MPLRARSQLAKSVTMAVLLTKVIVTVMYK